MQVCQRSLVQLNHSLKQRAKFTALRSLRSPSELDKLLWAQQEVKAPNFLIPEERPQLLYINMLIYP